MIRMLAASLSLHLRHNIIYDSPLVSALQAGPTFGIARPDRLFEMPRDRQLPAGTRQGARYLSKQKQSSEGDHSHPNKAADPHPNACAGWSTQSCGHRADEKGA
jgi:hypothetical protein